MSKYINVNSNSINRKIREKYNIVKNNKIMFYSFDVSAMYINTYYLIIQEKQSF